MLLHLQLQAKPMYSPFRLLLPAAILASLNTLGGFSGLGAQNCPPVNVKPRQCLVTREFDPFTPVSGSVPSVVNPLHPNAHSDLKVLVLGDSIMWGDGLPPAEKFVALFGQQLANLSGRTVRVISYAHSGARLGKIDDMNSVMFQGPDGKPYGDLDSERPTTIEQEECAAGQHPDAEIVLLDGCINDVGATNIALPAPFNFTDEKKIAADSVACRPFMAKVLQSALGHFPTATIIDVNYYRVVSTESRPLFKDGTAPDNAADLTREQQKLWSSTGKKAPVAAPPPNLMAPKAQALAIQPWAWNSDAFLATTQDCFHNAVEQLDGDSLTPCTAQYPLPYHHPAPAVAKPASAAYRVYLATVEDKPEYAYGVPNTTHLWKVPLPGDPDDFYNQRKSFCESVFGGNLVEIEKCLVNPTAHPNQKGAQAYSKSLVDIINTAWASNSH